MKYAATVPYASTRLVERPCKRTEDSMNTCLFFDFISWWRSRHSLPS
jgi:hypothetical protein